MARPTVKERNELKKENHILKAQIARREKIIADLNAEIADRVDWQEMTSNHLESAESALAYHEERAERYKAYADALAGVK